LRVKIGMRDASVVDMHAGQLTVCVETVRTLVAEQFPEWRGLPIRGVVSQGTVNALFRIGDKLLARFPLEPGDAKSTWRWLESEAQAARELLGRTRFRTPEPVALGEPGAGYPLPWSVQTWLPGTVATVDDPGRSDVSGGRLAGVIDVGGLGPADPALDLVGPWHLLEAGPRQVLRDDLQCGDLEWERGQAWAFEQSMGAVWYYAESNPAMSLVGQRTLQRIVADVANW
jgi:aminoglycoside phosphotransferase (APT) family kinase protein